MPLRIGPSHVHAASCRGTSRRGVLGGLAALGAAAMLPRAASAQPAAARPYRIDVHHHFFPPDYLEPLEFWGKQQGLGGLQGVQRSWSTARAIEEMDRTGVATAVLSISTPGIWFGDAAAARRMARLCNEYATEMRKERRGRFGLFASLPMPDVDGALKEIEYALDVLKADGVGLMTSYGDRWPGDPMFRPVFDELNRRKAVVYFHPLAPQCCGSLMPGILPSIVEYPHDTARAVVSLLFNGGFARWRDIRFIFSHGGASVPALSGRIANSAKARKDLAEIAPDGILAELKRLHYDTANAAYPPSMAALLALVPATQVLFGTDYPYLGIGQNLEGFGELGLSPAQRQAIDRDNAVRLMPRWSA